MDPTLLDPALVLPAELLAILADMQDKKWYSLADLGTTPSDMDSLRRMGLLEVEKGEGLPQGDYLDTFQWRSNWP